MFFEPLYIHICLMICTYINLGIQMHFKNNFQIFLTKQVMGNQVKYVLQF